MAGTTRAQARRRITAEIMAAAHRQLAEAGAAGLSLREIARDVGMVSSAIYRYVESRDDLLTRLIVEAYDSLGDAVEAIASAAHAEGDLERWSATAGAIRAWAVEHPYQYQLVYGSPVPGYAAPEDTVAPGVRVVLALAGIVADAEQGGRREPPSEPTPELGTDFADELRSLARAVPGDASFPADPAVVVAFLAAWSQLFGLISFELTNQTRGVVADHAQLFDVTARRMGHQIGLR